MMFAPSDLKKLQLQIQEATEVEPPGENDKDKNKTIEVYREYTQAAQLRKFAIEGYTYSNGKPLTCKLPLKTTK